MKIEMEHWIRYKVEVNFSNSFKETAVANCKLIKWAIILIRTWDVVGSHWVVGGRRWSRSRTQVNCVRRCDTHHMGHVLEEEGCRQEPLVLVHEILQRQLNLTGLEKPKKNISQIWIWKKKKSVRDNVFHLREKLRVSAYPHYKLFVRAHSCGKIQNVWINIESA